jgi:hypothetical protein
MVNRVPGGLGVVVTVDEGICLPRRAERPKMRPFQQVDCASF